MLFVAESGMSWSSFVSFAVQSLVGTTTESIFFGTPSQPRARLHVLTYLWPGFHVVMIVLLTYNYACVGLSLICTD